MRNKFSLDVIRQLIQIVLRPLKLRSSRFPIRIAKLFMGHHVSLRVSRICARGIRVGPASPLHSARAQPINDALKQIPPIDEELAPPKVAKLFEDAAGPGGAPDTGFAALVDISVGEEGALSDAMLVAGSLAGAVKDEYVAHVKIERGSPEVALHHRPVLKAAAKTVDFAARSLKLPVGRELETVTTEYLEAIGHSSVLETAHDLRVSHAAQHVHVTLPASTALKMVSEIARLVRGKTTPGTAARHVMVHGAVVTGLTWAGKVLAGFLAGLVASPAAAMLAAPVGGFLGSLFGRIISRASDAAPFKSAAYQFSNLADQALKWEPQALREVRRTIEDQKEQRERRYSSDAERLIRAGRSSYRRARLGRVPKVLGTFVNAIIAVRRTQRRDEARILRVLERKTLKWRLYPRRRLAAQAARENFRRAEHHLTNALDRFTSCYSQDEQLRFVLAWLRENRLDPKGPTDAIVKLASSIVKLGAAVREERQNMSARLQTALDRCVQRHRRRFEKHSAPVLANWRRALADWRKKLHGLGESMLRRAEEIGRSTSLGRLATLPWFEAGFCTPTPRGPPSSTTTALKAASFRAFVRDQGNGTEHHGVTQTSLNQRSSNSARGAQV